MKRVIYDHDGTVVRELHVEDPNDPFKSGVIHTVEDCAPLLREAKIARDGLDYFGKPKSDDFMPVAKIPVHVVEQAMREGWMNDRERWKRWLNDPDNRDFRIYGGTV